MVVGHSDEVDVHEAIASVLKQCEESLAGEEPKAGLLFATHDADPEVLVAAVRKSYPKGELIGSTSAGEMSSVLGFQEDSITLAMLVSDTVDITAGLGEAVTSDPRGAAKAAVEEALAKTDKEPRLCITVPSVLSGEPSQIVNALQEKLGRGITIFGGGAAFTDMGGSGSLEFYNDRVVQDGVPLLLFSGPIIFSVGVDTGWRPVGRKGRVTRSENGSLIEIDGAPAIEFYERYLGKGSKPSAANPLAVFEDDSDSFYLRVPRSHDPASGTILTPGAVPQDSYVQLTVAVTDEIFDGSRSAVQKAIKGYPEGQRPEGALIISCAVRKFVLGTRTGHELEIARRELGAALPICGFYSFGEIAPLDSGAALIHNETMVAVLLGTE